MNKPNSAHTNPRVSSSVPQDQLSVKEWRALSEHEQEALIDEAVGRGVAHEEWQRQWEVVVGAYQREVEYLRSDVRKLTEQMAQVARKLSGLNRSELDELDDSDDE